ncbi:unnamed protein product [Paramecium octaurelia]|uniref:2-phosphoglycerate kinase n=1 Tax=Paramecium octaurelia TaxID=43137 RepID=A0A8S1W9S8_PAROT|nr:unnamed protein product [Paramecium octaurelia]
MMQEGNERKISTITKNDNVLDLVKIKVRLDEHFYIFSRFMISRMLTLSRIKKLDAIQIAKDIKKQLIDRNSLEINSNELEAIIFQTMNKFGYQNNIQKYQMVSNFYRHRTPMIIIIFGAPSIGKSLLANNLAERLNISNVLQTDIVEMVMRSINPEQFNYDGNEDFITKFKKNCRLIRRGVSTDISKCLSEGKAVIIEGSAAMPEYYLEAIDQQDPEDDQQQLQLIASFTQNEIKLKKPQRKDLLLFNQQKKLNTQFKIIFPQPDQDLEDDQQIQKHLKLCKDLDKIDQSHSMILGFLPILSRNDHLYNIENNTSKKIPKDQIEEKLNQFQSIQNELLKQRSKCILLPINLHNLEETLDTMHDIILQKILDQSI